MADARTGRRAEVKSLEINHIAEANNITSPRILMIGSKVKRAWSLLLLFFENLRPCYRVHVAGYNVQS